MENEMADKPNPARAAGAATPKRSSKPKGLTVTASGGTNLGANLKPLEKRPRPMPMQAVQASPNPVAGGGGKMPRPKPRPDSKLAPKASMRPRTRSDKEAEDESNAAADRAMKHSQPPTLVNKAMGGKLEMVEKGGKKVPAFAADGVGKMALGGKCRGMGAATKGGNYRMG